MDSMNPRVTGLEHNTLYDSLLLERVGDTAFWARVFEQSNERYGEMWNEHLTTTDAHGVKSPLVPFFTMQIARTLSRLERRGQAGHGFVAGN